ncbi:MAG: UDP-N-acetylmuramoyl-L-alanine--D-glutamate ligase [Candidatus Uhrbacteria bacterium]|nr:UDP-N-acetylmuramoyl-L-alanine--D-glutamate ligase [Candidatus Uhrbacteria bacterium]
MRLADLNGKTIIILGYGKEGASTYDFLRARLPNARIIVTDEKRLEGVPAFHQIEDALIATTGETVVIKAPGIPWHRPVVEEMLERGAHFTSAMNMFMAERKGHGTLIGVTGTKGKSTTASLLHHVLTTAGLPSVLVGNIGTPSISHIDDPEGTMFVIEMSSYQLADLTTGPDIAVVLNLFEEHMDWHGDVASYHAAKMRIADVQTADDVLIYNERFPQLAELAKRVKGKSVAFHLADDGVLDTLNLRGEHNRENASAVLAVAKFLQVGRKDVETAFASFQALPHRLEDVGTVKGILFVNDSISTTPQSAMAAIDVFANNLGAIILGGQDRGYHFDELAKRVVDLHARTYIMPGGDHIADALRKAGGEPILVKTLDEAVMAATHHLAKGQVCLLSPASPSYGQFKNFEERGEVFRKAVQAVI